MLILIALYGYESYIPLEILHDKKEAQELVERAVQLLGIPSGFIGYELTFYKKDKPIFCRNYIRGDNGTLYWDEHSCKYNTHIASWNTFRKLQKKK